MLLIPAIDLQQGCCVRLRQGNFSDSTTYSTDPLAMAQYWLAQGAQRLHIVDLDGALQGQPKNDHWVRQIASQLPHLTIEVGGGIRDLATIENYLISGVKYIIIGTQAVNNKAFVQQACRLFSDHLIIAIDARDGQVAINGWLQSSPLTTIALAQQLADLGVKTLIYTDINRDGMLIGVNVAATAELAQQSGLNIIASGGISQLQDLAQLMSASKKITGAIIGRALYETQINFASAQQFCRNFSQQLNS